MVRLHRPETIAAIALLSVFLVAAGARSSGNCTASLEVWAAAMIAQLPSFANRQFSRANVPLSVIRTGPPEVERLTTQETAAMGVEAGTDAIATVTFSTSERWLHQVNSSDWSTQTLQRAYAVYLARPTQPPDLPWTVVKVEAAQPLQDGGGGRLAPYDTSASAIATAIGQWQQTGCDSD
jgi:hypothetical protein